MRVYVVGGTPSSGKSLVIAKMCTLEGGERPGVVKIDCVTTDDDKAFQRRGIPALAILAKRYCPDHAWMESLGAVEAWASKNGLTVLFVETAGLCARCAPYLREAIAICVLDCTCGIDGPYKLGPHLSDADLCVVTKGDLVSQAEREVFEARLKGRNPDAPIVWFNGLTGEGTIGLAEALTRIRAKVDQRAGPLRDASMRTPLPQLYCSYCLGRTEVGIATL